MGRPGFHSPYLSVKITDKNWEHAKKSASGACLIADALNEQYPDLTHPTADMTTCRVSDPKKGVRYTYFTPYTGQHILLAFDQGWDKPFDEVILKRAVKIDPIQARSAATVRARAARLAELEAKEVSSEPMLPREKAALTLMRKHPEVADRPLTRGSGVVSTSKSGGNSGGVTVHGGRPLPKKAKGMPVNPNLLAGRDRHYGAKLAKPGIAWEQAVDKAVEGRLDAAVDARLKEMGIRK